MFRLLERYQTIVIILGTILLPLLFYRANAAEPANANLLDRLVLAASAPLQRMMTWTVGQVSDRWSQYVDVFQARQENAELRRRLMVSERARDELSGVAVENEHLRGMVKIKEWNPKVQSIEANVIAAGTSPLARTIEIDRGSVDRVARGMVVISEAGLVGLVMRVGWTSSEVMLVADEKVTLSAVVVRTRARGRLKGSGLNPGFGVELTEILRSDDVRAGDRVSTSGLGGVYPRGIPIGEIKEVRTPTGAPHRVADVEPYVDFARLEQVMVLLEAPKDEPIVTPEPLRPVALRSGVPIELAARADAGADDAGPRGRARDAGAKAVRDGGVVIDAGAAAVLDAAASILEPEPFGEDAEVPESLPEPAPAPDAVVREEVAKPDAGVEERDAGPPDRGVPHVDAAPAPADAAPKHAESGEDAGAKPERDAGP